MSVIAQYYDIDLKATGEYPVVKMSQFDTGSRTIVFTVYDGRDLAQIDGMVARVDGTRSDGVEFTSTCTIGTGSKVSFTVSQEMTKHAGKHAAELVIFDASGNPIGTQNFLIEVEAATMVRDSAASADDRTLYDQFTDSVSKAVADKIAQMDAKYNEFTGTMTSKADALNRTAENISGLVGASSKAVTVNEGKWVNINVTPHQFLTAILQYDPVTALCVLDVRSSFKFDNLPPYEDTYVIMRGTDSKYLPVESEMDAVCGDIQNVFPVYHDVGRNEIYLTREGDLCFRTWVESSTATWHRPWAHVSWYARGGKYIGVTPTGSGGNTLKIGKTTTGEPGTQASVVNSGTAKDVVLDFTIPRGADGTGGSGYTLPVASASTLGGVKIGSGISVTGDGTISASGGSDSPIDMLGDFKGKALISHRGGTGYPEQSIAGCKWAVEHGYIPEVDVHLLADGTAVLCHDDTTTRTMRAKTSGAPTTISSIPDLADWNNNYELRPAITGGRTDPSPTLEALLQACGNRGILNIEVKQLDTATLDETLRLIKAYHCERSVIVASFSTSLMETAKGRGFTTMCFADSASGVSSVIGMTNKPDYCGISSRIMSSSTLESLHNAGIKVTVWAIDDYTTAQTALTGGYDGITSNRIDYVTNQLHFEGGDILDDGLLRCATPYNKDDVSSLVPFNGKGLYSFGGGFGFAGYAASGIDYVVIEPFDTMNIDLGDETDGKDGVFDVTVEGYTADAKYGSPTDRQSIVRLVLFTQDTPDTHWLDNNGTTPAAIQFFVRRNGQVSVYMEHGKFTTKEIHSNYVTGSDSSTAKWTVSSLVYYKLRVTYHSSHLSYYFCTPDGTSATGSVQFGINLSGLQKFALLPDVSVSVQDYRLSICKGLVDGYGTGR